MDLRARTWLPREGRAQRGRKSRSASRRGIHRENHSADRARNQTANRTDNPSADPTPTQTADRGENPPASASANRPAIGRDRARRNRRADALKRGLANPLPMRRSQRIWPSGTR
jgi:hypothetical protein